MAELSLSTFHLMQDVSKDIPVSKMISTNSNPVLRIYLVLVAYSVLDYPFYDLRNYYQAEVDKKTEDEDAANMQAQLLGKMQLLKRRQKELDNLINQYQNDKEPNQGII